MYESCEHVIQIQLKSDPESAAGTGVSRLAEISSAISSKLSSQALWSASLCLVGLRHLGTRASHAASRLEGCVGNRIGITEERLAESAVRSTVVREMGTLHVGIDIDDVIGSVVDEGVPALALSGAPALAKVVGDIPACAVQVNGVRGWCE